MSSGSEKLETRLGPEPLSQLYISAEEKIPELKESLKEKVEASDKSLSVHRRDFMKIFSLGAVAGAAASCVRQPTEKIVPYVKQPIDEAPGIAVHYASTCGACSAACGIMVKTREGRPVKIDGHKEHLVNKGGLCAVGQADLQGLYHPERLEKPQIRKNGSWENTSWENITPQIVEALKKSKKVGIFTKGSTGNRHKFFKDVLGKLGQSSDNLYTWESHSLYATMSEAHRIAFGREDLPRLDFSKAQMVLSIGSDFQTAGLSPTHYTKGFAQGRSVRSGRRSKFIAFESHLTTTGGNADKRYVIPPNSETLVALLLLKALYEQAQSKGSFQERKEVAKILKDKESMLLEAYNDLGISRDHFDRIAKELLQDPSLVVSGSGASYDENATLLQLATIMINTLCGSYEKTIFFSKGWSPSPIRVGDLQRFVKEAPSLDFLFIIDADPVGTVPDSWGMKSLISKIATVVSMQYFPSQSDNYGHFLLPTHHSLESWGDENPFAGFWSMRQPVVRPIKATSQAEDVLLWLLARLDKNLPYKNYRAYLKKQWEALYKVLSPSIAYETFFKAAIRRGFVGSFETRPQIFIKDGASHFKQLKAPHRSSLVLGTSFDHRLQDGRTAHLPVLQEIGDPMTTIAWDTWVAMNPTTMKKMGIQTNSLLKIKGPGGIVEVAAYPLPGLHPNSVIIPRGNGSQDSRSTITYKNGVNPLQVFAKAVDPLSGQPITSGVSVEVSKTGRSYRLAAMQKALDLDDRTDIVKSMKLKKAVKKKEHHKSLDDVPDLFPKLEEKEHRWGMSIDLDRCNGCGACMVACAVENNVPQVGREQVLMHRQMHWIRLDRYFHGDLDNPGVSIQPVMCQHCNQAPCEGVCPVYATTHDPEGLNSMTYNRCVGTRYCANACPYKVRRFNWWTHKWGEMGERPQDRNPRPTNPDVTVRTRGVMEKCSLCVQRARDAKHQAKQENRKVRDGDFVTACAQTCPSDAIVSGNLRDASSEITKLRKDGRAYLMLGGDHEHGHYGIKTLPNVSYLSEVKLDEEEKCYSKNSHLHEEEHTEGSVH